MCVDANAAQRHAAKQRWLEKDAKYKSESLKYFNREAQAVKNQNYAVIGLSRSLADDYQQARYAQGQAFRALEQGYSDFFSNKEFARSTEGGRSRTAGRRNLVKLLQARGRLEAGIENEFGANMARKLTARQRQYLAVQAKNRETLGVRPEYGAPVLMPPSDRLSGALSIASQVAGIYSGFGGTNLLKSLGLDG